MTRRFPIEQIIAILNEARIAGNARNVIRKYGISEQTFYRWRNKYRNMTEDDAAKLKNLEKEISMLRQRLRQLRHEEQMLVSIVADNLGISRSNNNIGYMINTHNLTEQQATLLVEKINKISQHSDTSNMTKHIANDN